MSFIPSFHFDPPSTKMTADWCKKAVDSTYHNTSNLNLLYNKNTKEIESYANGEFDLTPFKKLYKSSKKEMEKNSSENSDTISEELQYLCVPMIPTKLNSAEAIVQKIPTEITCTALDPLAVQKKQEDLNFLKNKPALENDLQDIADKFQIDKVDLGSTKHSSVPFADAPYDLDLNEPDELQVFVDLLYSLNVETAFETILQIFESVKRINQFRYLETKDQFRYGVSCHRVYQNSMTGLPDVKYEYPGNVIVPNSDLPDFSDTTHVFILERVTPLELFNYFSDEIDDELKLEQIVNGGIGGVFGEGYCKAQDKYAKSCPRGNWNSFKMDLLYCEIKSVDSLSVVTQKMGEDVYSYFSAEPKKDKKVSGKIWGQNTYCFYWLKNTKHFFGINKLGYAHRKKGLESYCNFSINIYKSQEKGCVELAIPENKKAQIAYIKMMYALIKSLPAGKVIDLKGMRGVIDGLKDENNEYTMGELIRMALQDNVMIIDTEGFDGKNDGQMKPYYDVPGGLKTEITGYLQVIQDAENKISVYTGINEALTGQSADPNGLIGLEKLRINQSLNALYYVTAAINEQYQKLFTIFASIIKTGIEDGGEVKKAIINMIGSQKVSIIDGLEDLPLHTMGVKIVIKQREEERAKFEQTIYNLKAQGVVSAADEYQLSVIQNPKDKFKYLAVKEKQFRKRAEAARAQDQQHQQELMQQQGQNLVAGKQAEAQGEKELAYAKGDVQAKIIQLSNQLNLNQKQTQALIDRQLTLDKQRGQVEKAVTTLQTKHNLENQQAFA